MKNRWRVKKVKPRKCKHCKEIFTPKFYNTHWCPEKICQDAYIEWKAKRAKEVDKAYREKKMKERKKPVMDTRKIKHEKTNWRFYKKGVCWYCPDDRKKRLNRFGLCKDCYILKCQSNTISDCYGHLISQDLKGELNDAGRI